MNETDKEKNRINPAALIMSAVLVLAVLVLLIVSANRDRSVSDVFDAMSTTVTVQLSGRDSKKSAAEIRSEAVRLENLLSMFIEGSDIYKINHAEGFVPLEPETCSLLEKCREYGIKSNGIFDVTVGNLTLLWGICSDSPRVPSPSEIDEALLTAGKYGMLAITEQDGISGIKTDGVLCIDPGGIAKGFVLERFREILDNSRINRGIISIGGNVLVCGDNGGKNYSVGLRIPVKYSNGYFCALTLSDTVVSTTGGYERFFTAPDGTVYNHVIDPRTGYPADNGLVSASVICPDATKADYLSTCLFILGEKEAAKLFEKLADEDIFVVLVNDKNTVRCSPELEPLMPEEKRSADFTFIFG